jgi:hypothetical protein
MSWMGGGYLMNPGWTDLEGANKEEVLIINMVTDAEERLPRCCMDES